MKKLLSLALLISGQTVFADSGCSEMVKKTVGLLASGSVPVAGRYAVEVRTLQENAILKKVDSAGYEESVKVNVLRATALFSSYGTSYKAWVADEFASNKGCTILKITLEGVR